jgi:hypothetical protein
VSGEHGGFLASDPRPDLLGLDPRAHLLKPFFASGRGARRWIGLPLFSLGFTTILRLVVMKLC